MVKHPEVLRKAQEEIDSVVGHSRLPMFRDRSSLPYIDAMFTETLRWGCPLPLSTLSPTLRSISLTLHVDFPHKSMEDVYQGYRIPNGSYVGICFTNCEASDSFYPSGD